MNSKRIGYLDMVKGIGIILVVLGHSAYCGYDLLTVIASFHMPLFFIVSGYLMNHIGEEKHSMKELLLKKARTILIPYAVFSVIYLVIYGGYFCAVTESLTPAYIKNMALQSISLGGASVLWFLTALFFAELYFMLVKKHTNRIVTALLVGIPALFAPFLKAQLEAYLPVTNDALKMLSYFLQTMLRSFVGAGFLLIGYELYFLLKKQRNRWLEAGAGILGMGGVIAISLWNGRTDLHYLIFGNVPVYFFCAALAAVSLILLCRACKEQRLLRYLGANSLIIMVTHLDCQYMLLSVRLGQVFVALSPYAKWYCLYAGIALGMFVLELITIYVINHYFPFLIGKRYLKK